LVRDMFRLDMGDWHDERGFSPREGIAYQGMSGGRAVSTMLCRVRELEARLPTDFEVWENEDLVELRHPPCGCVIAVFSSAIANADLLSISAHRHSSYCGLLHGAQKISTPTV
jgi:hypothetical protein